MNRRIAKLTRALAALALGTFPAARADDAVSTARAAAGETSWHSPSLTMKTVTGPNGVVTTPTALRANALWGITDKKVAETVIPGVYALRGLGNREQLRHRGPGRLDRHRHGRLHARSSRDAGDARADPGQEDQGRGHPVHALALRRRDRVVAGPGNRDLGPRTPRPQPTGLHRGQRPERCDPGASGGPVRGLPSPHGPGRLPQPARVHAGEAPGRVELPAAHPSLRERQDPRPRDRRRARPGRAQSFGRVRQRGLLLPPSPSARDERHGDGERLQHLHAPGRFVPRPGELHQRRALDRGKERRDPPRHPRSDPQGREARAGGGRAVGRPGPAHPRPDPAPHRPGHGREGGGREPLHAAPHARRARDVRAGREPRPPGLQREHRLVRRGRLRDQSALAARGGTPGPSG